MNALNSQIEKDRNDSYEEPILLGAEDLEDVVGGCLFSCSDGSCRPKASSSISGTSA